MDEEKVKADLQSVFTKLIEEMDNYDDKKPYVRPPGEMNSYEKYNRTIASERRKA